MTNAVLQYITRVTNQDASCLDTIKIIYGNEQVLNKYLFEVFSCEAFIAKNRPRFDYKITLKRVFISKQLTICFHKM